MRINLAVMVASLGLLLGPMSGAASAAIYNISGQSTFTGQPFEIEDYSFDVEQTLNIGQKQGTSPVLINHVTFSQDGVAVSPPPVSLTFVGGGRGRFDLNFPLGDFLAFYGPTIVNSDGRIGPVGVYDYTVGLGDAAATGVGQFTITAVPEPATWALMLAGIGGLGLALRARRRPAVAA